MTAKLAFTFDDTNLDTYSEAFPILAAQGFAGTSYVLTSVINGGDRMTTANLLALKAAGWEIGSHSVTHPSLASLTETAARAELANSKATLVGLGLEPISFGPPSRSWSTDLATWSADYYQAIRAVTNTTNIVQALPASDLHNVTNGTNSLNSTTYPPATVEGWIDQAIAEDGLLILLLHHVRDMAGDLMSYSISDFTDIVAYAKTKVDLGTLVVQPFSVALGLTLPTPPLPPTSTGTLPVSGALAPIGVYSSGDLALRLGSTTEYARLVTVGAAGDTGVHICTPSGTKAFSS